MSKKNHVEDSNAKLSPITHITLNTGHRSLVPINTIDPHEFRRLEGLVKAGGGPITPLGKGYRFAVVADGPECCDIIIFKDGRPITLCGFQDGSQTAEANWNRFVEWDYALPPAIRSCKPHVEKPREPWLAVKQFPTCALAGSDLPFIAAFERCVAETWRRLPMSERSPLCPPELAQHAAASSGSDGTGQHSGASRTDASGLTAQIASLVERNTGLSGQLKALITENRGLKSQRKATARLPEENVELRREADRLRDESSAKDARIQALEAGLAAVRAEIDRRVAEKVGDARKTAEENELRVLVADEERAEALRRADKAERVSKRLELLLRKNGIEPAMAFADVDHGSCEKV